MKRVILKLSGEALAGEQKSGYDDALIADIARQVKAIIDKGIAKKARKELSKNKKLILYKNNLLLCYYSKIFGEKKYE